MTIKGSAERSRIAVFFDVRCENPLPLRLGEMAARGEV